MEETTENQKETSSEETETIKNNKINVQNDADSTVKKEDATVADSNKNSQEEVYPIGDLIDNCEALGYKKEIAAGAFSNYEKQEITKSQFDAQIKAFLKRKVN